MAECKLVAAAVLLAVDFFQTLLQEPFADFEIADHRGPGPFGDGDSVADMVAVTVRDEDEVSLGLVSRDRRRWIAGQEGVDQQARAVDFDVQAGVAKPADARRHQILLRRACLYSLPHTLL